MRIIQNELGEELGRHRSQLLHRGRTGMLTQPSPTKRIGIYQMRHGERMPFGSGCGWGFDEDSLRLKMAHQLLRKVVGFDFILYEPFFDQ